MSMPRRRRHAVTGRRPVFQALARLVVVGDVHRDLGDYDDDIQGDDLSVGSRLAESHSR